jgi:hypothetical protein
MGANATTFVPAYVAGEVLTAADLSVTNSGIPVFADSTARTAAFGGTGEKVLAEGQYAYLESDNSTSVYDGSNWISVGVTPGLVYITGATFTSVTSVSLPANTFSATYTNYLVQFNAAADSAEALMTSRFRAAGADNTTSNYSYGVPARYSNGNDASTEGNAVSSFGYRSIYNGLTSSQTLTICGPQAATKTSVTGTMVGNGNTSTALANGMAFGGIFNATTSFDSYSFLASTAITGSYKVYGYSNS